MTALINKSAMDHQYIILDFEEISSIDISVASALEDNLKSLSSQKSVKMRLRRNDIYLMFSSLGILSLLPPENLDIID